MYQAEVNHPRNAGLRSITLSAFEHRKGISLPFWVSLSVHLQASGLPPWLSFSNSIFSFCCVLWISFHAAGCGFFLLLLCDSCRKIPLSYSIIYLVMGPEEKHSHLPQDCYHIKTTVNIFVHTSLRSCFFLKHLGGKANHWVKGRVHFQFWD